MLRFFLFLLLILFSFSVRSQGPTLEFDGNNDYVSLGTEVSNNIRTIELWFRLDEQITPALTEFVTLVARNNTLTVVNPFEIGLVFVNLPDEYGTLRFFVWDGNGNRYKVNSNADTWEPDVCHHVVGTIDPVEGMKLYIDGVLQDDTDPYTNDSGVTDKIFTIGRWGDYPHRHLFGAVEELSIWSRSLSEEEVLDHMNNGVDPTSDGLKAYYPMDEGSGSIINDVTGNGYDGNIIGSNWVDENLCPGCPQLTFDLGPDQIICPGEQLVIDLQEHDEVSWSDGVESKIRTIDAPGNYEVQVTTDGCSYEDDILVGWIEDTITDIISEDTLYLINGQSIEVTTLNNLLATWPDKSISESHIFSETGTFQISSMDVCDIVYDTLTIQELELFIPNIFTPNGDGFNDFFEIKNLNETGLAWTLRVYNRLGKEIYFNENYRNLWDGEQAPSGVYYYNLRNEKYDIEFSGWVNSMY